MRIFFDELRRSDDYNELIHAHENRDEERKRVYIQIIMDRIYSFAENVFYTEFEQVMNMPRETLESRDEDDARFKGKAGRFETLKKRFAEQEEDLIHNATGYLRLLPVRKR